MKKSIPAKGKFSFGGKKIYVLLMATAIFSFIVNPVFVLAEDLPAAQTNPPPVAEEIAPLETNPKTPEQPPASPTPESLLEPEPPAAAPTSTPNSPAMPDAVLSPEQGVVGTTFSETVGTGGQALASPAVKAIWQMKGTSAALLGADDGAEAKAQFLPSGQYRVSKPISVCAVVSGAGEAANEISVSATVNYPDADFGPSTTDGRIGCGKEKAKYQMSKMAKEQGLALFCQVIQQNNANLPEFSDIANYSSLCGQDGELEKETAAVFCADGELLYNDVSGEYKVSVAAADNSGVINSELKGSFSYLELTAYEIDFKGLNYGSTGQNGLKTVEGDPVWQKQKGENSSTVRNVGNTRLQIAVTQDDMGLGKIEGEWNIRYGSRVGAAATWKNYWPQETVVLDTVLNLAGMEPISFAITVLRFPQDSIINYSGSLTLGAEKVEHLACGLSQ